jgi:hypothetical protein
VHAAHRARLARALRRCATNVGVRVLCSRRSALASCFEADPELRDQADRLGAFVAAAADFAAVRRERRWPRAPRARVDGVPRGSPCSALPDRPRPQPPELGASAWIYSHSARWRRSYDPVDPTPRVARCAEISLKWPCRRAALEHRHIDSGSCSREDGSGRSLGRATLRRRRRPRRFRALPRTPGPGS